MSNQMNPWLASIYGTEGADDIEKTAQAHLLHKLAAQSNLDISQLSPEQIEQLVQELAVEGYDVGALMQPQQQGGDPQQGMQPGGGFPQQQPQVPPQRPQQGFAQAQQPQPPQGMQPFQMAQQNQQPDAAAMQKEAQAKFEEADLLGRVMAHAYTDELEKIAGQRKTAGKMDAAKNALKGAADKAKGFGGRAAAHVKNNKGAYAAGAGGAAAGFAAGRMSKKASAFEKLAEEHAAEILNNTGYNPSTGEDVYGQQMLQNSMQQPQAQPQQQQFNQNFQQPQQGQQGQQPAYPQQQAGVEQPQVEQQGEDQYSQALDQRALELLAENGYDVNEILARIELGQRQPQAQA
jgi:hypothetical protein